MEEEDPYYIRLQTLDEVLPPYCMFDNITRESAERYNSCAFLAMTVFNLYLKSASKDR